jgi:hypothetical protein
MNDNKVVYASFTDRLSALVIDAVLLVLPMQLISDRNKTK